MQLTNYTNSGSIFSSRWGLVALMNYLLIGGDSARNQLVSMQLNYMPDKSPPFKLTNCLSIKKVTFY